MGGLRVLARDRDRFAVVLVGQHHWQPGDIDAMSVRDFVRALAATDTYNTAINDAINAVE